MSDERTTDRTKIVGCRGLRRGTVARVLLDYLLLVAFYTAATLRTYPCLTFSDKVKREVNQERCERR
jgi:hypothetical protein